MSFKHFRFIGYFFASENIFRVFHVAWGQFRCLRTWNAFSFLLFYRVFGSSRTFVLGVGRRTRALGEVLIHRVVVQLEWERWESWSRAREIVNHLVEFGSKSKGCVQYGCVDRLKVHLFHGEIVLKHTLLNTLTFGFISSIYFKICVRKQSRKQCSSLFLVRVSCQSLLFVLFLTYHSHFHLVFLSQINNNINFFTKEPTHIPFNYKLNWIRKQNK